MAEQKEESLCPGRHSEITVSVWICRYSVIYYIICCVCPDFFYGKLLSCLSHCNFGFSAICSCYLGKCLELIGKKESKYSAPQQLNLSLYINEIEILVYTSVSLNSGNVNLSLRNDLVTKCWGKGNKGVSQEDHQVASWSLSRQHPSLLPFIFF